MHWYDVASLLCTEFISGKPGWAKQLCRWTSATHLCLFSLSTFLDTKGFPDSSVGKESAYNAGDPSSIPGSRRSAGEGIDYPLQYSWASPEAQLVKNPPVQCRRPGFNPWVGNISWKRERLPTPVFWPREFHGLYSPWGCKESDMTEPLSL